MSTITKPSFNIVNKSDYLGFPKNEDEWLKYVGKTIIFVGTKYDEDNDCWELETEDETKTKLINGLKTVGVICEDIQINWECTIEGTRYCECICLYNKPYQVYVSEFFINGLSNSDKSEMPDTYVPQLEFYFDKLLGEPKVPL